MKTTVGIFWAITVMGILVMIIKSSEPEHERYGSRGAEEEAKYGNKFLEGWFGWWRNPPDRFAALIAIFTAGLFGATYGLWDATKELVKDARETSERQLRAYVGLQSMEATVYPFEKGGFVVLAHAEARNFGQTPAYRMTVQANATVDVPTAIPFDEAQGTAKSAGAMTAFKDVGFQISQTKIITAEDAQAIRNQKKIIFFWGAIKYRDAFGKDHTFKFRMISDALAIGSTTVWSMVAHPLGFEDED
jgi:hypothetical protein